ncbi:uncharacterized protein LOC108155946 [Drosophila miranda]|uniref:uncharacterized protein LOC108155946 n=1 Tax=Drosophila miranda TaxID=7229 RepID=UPI0007E6B49B|nr:uncharacterized protein LOC108155946 [Drosophila miranda]
MSAVFQFSLFSILLISISIWSSLVPSLWAEEFDYAELKEKTICIDDGMGHKMCY